jgi:hypothetical protein
MSFEASVSALLLRTDLLLAQPQQVYDQATAAVARLEAAALARLSGVSSFVVDQAAGLDDPARSGSAAQPLKTIEAALARTPVGSTCFVLLAGPYLVSTIVAVTDKTLCLASSSSVRHALTFTRATFVSGGTYRNLSGFRLAHKAQIGIANLTIVMPPADGVFPGAIEYQESAVIRVSGSPQDAFTAVVLLLCDLSLPATPFGRLVSHSGSPLALTVNSCTLTDQPLIGRLMNAQTNTTTGVATSTYRWLLTNLATI